MTSKKWFIRRSTEGRTFRLFCLPYAGGNAAAYLDWQGGLDRLVEVCSIQLPGRGSRMAEPLCTNFFDLIQELTTAIAAENDKPFALFGHSMGALLAFEVARELMRRDLPMPQSIFVSGHRSPRISEDSKHLHALPHESLMSRLREFGSIPPEILANKEMMDYVLPILRADLSLMSTYAYQQRPLLNQPIYILAGLNDDLVKKGLADEWKKETTGATDLKFFDGGHFFIRSMREEVLEYLNIKLRERQMT